MNSLQSEYHDAAEAFGFVSEMPLMAKIIFAPIVLPLAFIGSIVQLFFVSIPESIVNSTDHKSSNSVKYHKPIPLGIKAIYDENTDQIRVTKY